MAITNFHIACLLAASACISSTAAFFQSPGMMRSSIARQDQSSVFVSPAISAPMRQQPLAARLSMQELYKGPATTPLLDQVMTPDNMKGFNMEELKQLSHELRWEVLECVSKTGGHLGSSLGVIELTVALNYVFNPPDDRIVWDVSHQVYPHKILTGRRDKMDGLRKLDGLSGFCKRSESIYDAFGAGHSSTSISAALGMKVGKELQGIQHKTVAVIGDGAITGGMAYEAMNNAGYLKSNTIVVLNDNGQVSLPTGTPSYGGTRPASGLSDQLGTMLTSAAFKDAREMAKGISGFFPTEIQEVNKKIDEYARGLVSGEKATLFEQLGFYYVGPVEGHNLETLVPILENLRDIPRNKPILLHVKTEKGKGYPPAERASDKYHGMPKFNVATGEKQKGTPSIAPSYTSVFAKELIDIAQTDRKVVGITAAMPGGTGIDQFGRYFPKRTFDVGIAEQHAVTFAAGMAVEGVKPFCAIYSTFLQRGFDQVVHDVVLQQLPVRLMLDRAGLVGNDGATHHGSFDLAYLGCLPDIIIMAPSDEVELMHMVRTAYECDHLPTAVRFPRGSGYGLAKLNSHMGHALSEMPKRGTALTIGRGRVVKEAKADAKHKVAILSLGARLMASVEAAQSLEAGHPDVSITVADARFMKPLDIELIRKLAEEHEVLVTIEEGSVGGFGDHVLHFLALDGGLDTGTLKVRPMVLPDTFIEQATQNEQYEQAGLQPHHIERTVLKLLDRTGVPRSVKSISKN